MASHIDINKDGENYRFKGVPRNGPPLTLMLTSEELSSLADACNELYNGDRPRARIELGKDA